MALGNFYDIMIAIIGTPANDIQATILYFISAVLASSLIFMVFYLFGLAGKLLTPR